MKMCDRCPGAYNCLLNYNGKACEKWRKKNAPGVFFTNADRIRSKNDYELAVMFAMLRADLSVLDRLVIEYNGQDMYDNLVWLQQPAEEEDHD